MNALAIPVVDFEKGGTKILPSLAQSWDVSKDGKTYTFKLRKGVEFHTTSWFTPKRNFNADDVLFTFNRMWKKDHPFHGVGGGSYEYFTSMEMDSALKSIDKVDDYTVRFVLTRPEAPFLANMAMDFASILSAEYGNALLQAKTPEKIDTEPVGTGPFVFQKYVKDTNIRFEAHPKYFEGKAKIEKLVFAITPDANVRYQKLKRGECQLIAEPPQADLASMRADQNIHVLDRDGLNVGYLAMNTERGPFRNPLVRQAINYALNRKAYIEAIYLNNASMAKNPIPPSMWGYADGTKDYLYNPEKAKEMLRQAGYDKGFEATLWWLPITRPYNPQGKKMAEMMQADLAKVGVRVKLESADWGTYLDKAKKGEPDMIQLGWTGDNGDPDNFLNVLLSCSGVKGGSNAARWCNKSYDDTVDQARRTADLKKRTELYVKAQKIFKEQAPWVTLAHARVFRAMRSNVEGFEISPFGSDAFYGVDVK